MSDQKPPHARAMVMTVGTGSVGTPDSLAEALADSIVQVSPEFITSIETEDSAKTRELVQEILTDQKGSQISSLTWRKIGPIPDHGDTNRIVPECLSAIQHYLDVGIDAEEIIVNYTSGTKAMSASAALAGSQLGCGLLYISVKRKDGRIVEGSEKLISDPPHAYSAYRDLSLAHTMLERLQFGAAMTLCRQLQSPPDQKDWLNDHDRNYRFQLYRLAKAYDEWDKFRHSQSAKEFARLSETTSEIDQLLPSSFINDWLSSQESGPQSRDSYTPDLIADLIANADRRIYESKWDDATARLYRATEMLAQMVLLKDEYQIDTGEVDLSGVDTDVRDRVIAKIGSQTKIGIENAYFILGELGREVGHKFSSGKHNVSNLTQHRNQSILAHGTQPVKVEHSKKFREHCVALIKLEIPDIADRITEHQFPWLRDEIAAILGE